MTPIDARPADLDTVRRILREHVPDLEVHAFGSRVNWNARETSDLDVALMTDKPLTVAQMADLRAAFTAAALPFRVDVVDWASTSEAFREVIDAEYVVLDCNGTSAPADWIRLSLADACSAIDYGLTASASNERSGPKFLRITDIVSEQIDWNSVPYVAATDRTTEKYRLHDGDIVVARTGASTGASAYIKDPPRAVFASYLVRLQAKPDFSARFLAYVLKSEAFWEYIRGVLGDKSAQPNASASTMTAVPIRAPRDKAKQCEIAHILGTLDDKIELNRRMNATLEAMARALFRSWFVDFDPVRAKMEGRDTGLPKEIADLFPDRLVDSELGAVPEEWDVGVLDDAVELLNGGTPRTSVERFWNGHIPWYTAKDAPAPHDVFAVETERTITQAGVDNSATVVLPSGTTVISARGSVGRLACLGRPMAMNQTCYGIRGAGGYGDFFTYWLVRGTVEELRSRTHGTIFDTITRQTFALVNSALPPVSIADAFESVVQPIMERILSNLHQSGTIAVLRDTLLPKLVSGELRVAGLEAPSRGDVRPVPVGTHGA